MQKRRDLEFQCQGCSQPISFSILSIDASDEPLSCTCGKQYRFQDEGLKRQLKKFVALCSQLMESEEILSRTAVGIDIGDHHVTIPYQLLLTRLNSKLELMIGTQPLTITFRVEPLKDLTHL